MWVGERIQEMKLAGIRRFAAMAGWEVVPVAEAESRPQKLSALLKRFRPAGVIVECSAAHKDLSPKRFGPTPVVYLDCSRTLYGKESVRITHDGKATVKAVFRELASTRPDGYAFVGYRFRRTWSELRERAFKRLTAEAGMSCRVFPFKVESEGARAVRLAEWLGRLPRKTAVFAANDQTAVEILAAAQTSRLSIPRDFTVVGVDNLDPKEPGPTLSSVQVDSELAGYRAAQLLDEVMRSGSPVSGKTTYGPLLTVRRESTRGFGRREPRILSAVDLIRREACNGLTAANVVKHLGGSRRLVDLRFRETLGHSILDEIENVRLEKVCYLLAHTETPIGAIASLCGYKTDIALRKFFRERMGQPLSAWRKANAR